MKVGMLFPTPVAELNVDTHLCKRYADIVQETLKNQVEFFGHKDLSECTHDDLNTRNEYTELVAIIDKNVQKFSNFLGLEDNSLAMSCMWSNVHYNGNSHQVHCHTNSFVSGVLYLQTPETIEDGQGNFFVMDPRSGSRYQQANYIKPSVLGEKNWHFKPEVGKMLLFPSWLEHGTTFYKNEKNEKRISIAFNYILKRCGNAQTVYPTLAQTFDVSKL